MLTTRPTPDDADLAWAAEAAHSLAGLMAPSGDAALVDEARRIEAAFKSLQAPGAAHRRAEATVEVVERVRAIEAALGRRGAAAAREVALDDIVAAATSEVRRVADRRGVTVGLDVRVAADVRLSRRIAGVLLDALGHVARDAASYGTPQGGSVRMVVERDGDGLVVVVSDHGKPSSASAAAEGLPDDGRGVGLRAARGRLVAIGGDVSSASGAWGGTSVTLRVPMRR